MAVWGDLMAVRGGLGCLGVVWVVSMDRVSVNCHVGALSRFHI